MGNKYEKASRMIVLQKKSVTLYFENIEPENMENNNQQISIDLPADVADGVYSNLAIISHSNSEFIVDFARMMPGTPKAKVMSRVILTPEHAKKLLAALQDNIQKYEQNNGPIKITQNIPIPTIGNSSAQA